MVPLECSCPQLSSTVVDCLISKRFVTLVLFRKYLQEEEDLRLLNKEREDQLYSRLRSTRLNEYVGLVRKNLHEQRSIEKQQRRQAEMEKIKEQKRKLMEARLKALAGE